MEDEPSEQFTQMLLRYLARRAQQAQEGGPRNDDEDDSNESPLSPDTENEDAAWSPSFFRSQRKKKLHPKLDLVDEKEYDHNEQIGRLKQWIDDGQIDDIEKHIAIQNKEEEKEETKEDSDNHRPLIRQDIHQFIPFNFNHFMNLREIGHCPMYGHNNRGAMGRCADYFFSNNVIEKFQGHSRVFCSDFSNDGNVLCVASQDHVIHLIDSRSGANSDRWPIYKQVESQFSGWSIIDVALSPDHEFVAYSGWSSSIYLVNTYGSHELHESHNLNISTFNSWGRCCVFGVEFDPNSKKVICALSGGCLILHDLERKMNEFADQSAHDDDINQATFLDANIIISGSDDALLKVWDVRQKEKCVGGFVGHYQGITCVSTPNDYGSSHYVLSNSKDQSMKLWDLRVMNTSSECNQTRDSLQPSTGSFDYRYRGWNAEASSTNKKKFRIDKSLITYRGHNVSRTLCRSGFSPVATTSAKYVYCGSADGKVYIYETATGKLHRTLMAHSDIVRDVCWHPSWPIIVSASWDGSVVRWSYKASEKDGCVKEDTSSVKQGKEKGVMHEKDVKLFLDEIDDDDDDDDCVESDDTDIEDDVFKLPQSVPLDMPEDQRKRNNHHQYY